MSNVDLQTNFSEITAVIHYTVLRWHLSTLNRDGLQLVQKYSF